MRKRRRSRLSRWLWVACLLLVGLFLLFDLQWRPLLLSNAVSQAKIVVSDAVTAVAAEVLADFESRGEPLLTQTCDQSGQVRSLSLNALAVDRIKSGFLLAYQQRAEGELTFRTTVGTLSGIDCFNAMGPYLTFSAEVSQHPDVALISTLQEAGINQTVHRVLLRVEVEVNCLFPGGGRCETVMTEYLVAETVLLGEVPGTYATIGTR